MNTPVTSVLWGRDNWIFGVHWTASLAKAMELQIQWATLSQKLRWGRDNMMDQLVKVLATIPEFNLQNYMMEGKN